MKNNKLNMIKLNITTILSLMCISCSLIDQIDTKLKSLTNPKESEKNFLNKSQNPKLSNQESLEKEEEEKEKEKEKEKEEKEDDDDDDIISKLKAISKKLQAQERKVNRKIAKIADAKLDFLDTFQPSPHGIIPEDEKIVIKRIIYSSLNYEKQKINTLKEILEKLYQYIDHERVLPLLMYFLHRTAFFIQKEIEGCLELIQNRLHNLKQNEFELLHETLEKSLTLKQKFAKKLNETIEAYNQNLHNIKNDMEELAWKIHGVCEELGTLRPIK
ncbi:complement regulator-acquiring protein (plasmid) [Borreliella garinii]|uniref:complement regulator-acquiring protein n=1 Tax=Borreliella garinii TaxID=29519 RepID=UPI00292E1221|nr:complement regulator-acquiring protein [Borreliella garinii]WNZ69237.1 complement regulator-acquiring protein [Borreliella garinii]